MGSPRQTLTKFTLDDLLHQNTSARKVHRRKVGASCFPAFHRWTEVCSEDAGEEGAQRRGGGGGGGAFGLESGQGAGSQGGEAFVKCPPVCEQPRGGWQGNLADGERCDLVA